MSNLPISDHISGTVGNTSVKALAFWKPAAGKRYPHRQEKRNLRMRTGGSIRRATSK